MGQFPASRVLGSVLARLLLDPFGALDPAGWREAGVVPDQTGVVMKKAVLGRGLAVGVAVMMLASCGSAATSSDTQEPPQTQEVDPSKPASQEAVEDPAGDQESAVASEEQAPEPEERGIEFGDGVWLVGEDFPAGKYTLTEEPVSCYWAVLRAGANGEDIIANDNVSGGFPTVTLRKGQEFESNDCGTWTSKPRAGQLTEFGDGAWAVGRDVKAGTYALVDEPIGCYWAVIKSGTNGDNILANDNIDGGFPTVTLRKGTDFVSSDCGTWTSTPSAPMLAEFGDGAWTVGRDVKPGRYRLADTVLGDCYWAITKAGTNGDNIIENDIVVGGRPTVTLSKGQEFVSNDCGVWVRS